MAHVSPLIALIALLSSAALPDVWTVPFGRLGPVTVAKKAPHPTQLFILISSMSLGLGGGRG